MRIWICAAFIVGALGAASPALANQCARLCTAWFSEPQCVDAGNGSYQCDAMAKMTCGAYRWYCVLKSPVPLPYVERVTWKQPGSFSAPFTTAESAPDGIKPLPLKPAKRGP